MTTVQKEKMARRKLSLLRLAQELGKRVAAQGNPGELDGRVGSCFGNRRTRGESQDISSESSLDGVDSMLSVKTRSMT